MRNLFTILLSVLLLACGGGGGGGGGADGSGGRSTGLGLRILHASIDTTPVELVIGEEIIQSARFGQPRFYTSVPSGQQTLRVQRANSPGVFLTTTSVNFEDDTEYSLLLAGSSRSNSLRAFLLEDLNAEPESGQALLRIVNGRLGGPSIVVTTPLGDTAAIAVNTGSEFIELSMGPTPVTVKEANGAVLWSGTVTLEDRGELTLLVTGSDSLEVTFVPTFTDLD